jgi:membrane protein YqaA with SNARE-associated domain
VTEDLGLGGLFVAALIAATPFPFNSEIVLLGLLAAGWPATALVVVATVGNVLGSCITFAIGRKLGSLRDNPRFPIRPGTMDRAEVWFRRWGPWTLLVSWLPMGDVIVAIAGALRVPVPLFLVLVTVAKLTRYIAVAWLGAKGFSSL